MNAAARCASLLPSPSPVRFVPGPSRTPRPRTNNLPGPRSSPDSFDLELGAADLGMDQGPILALTGTTGYPVRPIPTAQARSETLDPRYCSQHAWTRAEKVPSISHSAELPIRGTDRRLHLVPLSSPQRRQVWHWPSARVAERRSRSRRLVRRER